MKEYKYVIVKNTAECWQGLLDKLTEERWIPIRETACNAGNTSNPYWLCVLERDKNVDKSS